MSRIHNTADLKIGYSCTQICAGVEVNEQGSSFRTVSLVRYRCSFEQRIITFSHSIVDRSGWNCGNRCCSALNLVEMNTYGFGSAKIKPILPGSGSTTLVLDNTSDGLLLMEPVNRHRYPVAGTNRT
jgi:hypothetical protein